MGPLVDVRWLSERLADADLRLIDFRWYLSGPRTGREDFERGHIPGAVFVDLEDVTGAPGPGRHPLPSREQFQSVMRAAGVSQSSRVVVYDQTRGYAAARLWWLLRAFGHRQVAVLDGGADAWPGPWATDPTLPEPGDFVAEGPAPAGFVDYQLARASQGRALFLDARAPERYRGDSEPIDAQAGHIPGARSAFYADILAGDGRLLPAARLREHFAALGVGDDREVVVYCGSGVSACLDLLALEVAGLPGARLYEGSWSDWSAQPGAPVATGAEP